MLETPVESSSGIQKKILSALAGGSGFEILLALQEGPLRFSHFEKRVDVSPRTLSESLKHLEAVGLVTRTPYAEVPPRVEYALTEFGSHVCGVLQELS